MARERDIEKYLKQQVELAGGEVRKVQWVGRRGAPDRVVMMRGQTWWVELKAPGKVPAPHQAREHERMQKMGQTVMVIDSKEGVDEIMWPYSPNFMENMARKAACDAYSTRPAQTPTTKIDV